MQEREQEMRQTIGVEMSNKANWRQDCAERDHEPQLNPAARNEAVELGQLPAENLPQDHGQDRQAGEEHAGRRDYVEITERLHVPPSGGFAPSPCSRVRPSPGQITTVPRAYHQRLGQGFDALALRARKLCQANANRASNKAPAPTGTIRKLHDMLLRTITSGLIPAGG